ncbi:MAG TPA: hypothetical protein VMN38_07135 [Sphingomicrobium sp.]|nr:hypothetical protein [Sphingomicrobium sp.]
MTVMEYVSVFAAIIVSLAAADLLTSFHRLFRASKKVTWDWMAPVLGIQMLFLTVSVWWRSYNWYAGLDSYPLYAFIPDFAILLSLFLVVSAVLPDEIPAKGINLRKFYLAEAPYIWTIYGIGSLIVLVHTYFRHPMGEAGLFSFLLWQWPNLLGIAIAVAMRFRPHLSLHYAAILGFMSYTTYLNSLGVIGG